MRPINVSIRRGGAMGLLNNDICVSRYPLAFATDRFAISLDALIVDESRYAIGSNLFDVSSYD